MSVVHLVLPPVWPTDAPYLSIPSLAAYLRRNCGCTVRSIDLNLRFWTELRSPSNLTRIYDWASQRLQLLDSSASTADLSMYLRLACIKGLSRDQFVNAHRSQSLPVSVLDALAKLYFGETVFGHSPVIGLKQWDAAYDYHDPFFASISMSDAARDAEHVLALATGNAGPNPFRDILPRLYMANSAGTFPEVLGISVTAVNQVVPALTLAAWMKEASPRTLVVMGGAWVTHVLSGAPVALTPLLRTVDALVFGEGERPLAEIVARSRDASALPNIPGVLTAGTPQRDALQRSASESLDELPTPDFSDLPLHDYDRPGLLPLQASRGCSWGRCRFCSYPVVDPEYKTRDPSLVAADVELLQKRYGASEIAFSDSLMEPRAFSAIAQELLSRRLDVKWRGFGRFDRNFTSNTFRLMAQAGCHYIIWGLETASPRILRLMCKGNTPKIISANLNDAAAAGIHNRACLIYGYPGETLPDVQDTVAFLKARLSAVHSVAFCHFTAIQETPIGRSIGQRSIGSHDGSLVLKARTTPTKSSWAPEAEQLLRRLWLEVERCPQKSTLSLAADAWANGTDP